MKRQLAVLLIICVLSAVFCGCTVSAGVNGKTTIRYDDSENYVAGNTTWGGSVDRVLVCWVAGDVILQTGDVLNITVEENCVEDLEEKWQVHSWVDDGTLYVQYAARGTYRFGKLTKNLTVTLPADMEAEFCSLETVSGLNYLLIPCERVEADSVSGDIIIRNARNVEVDSVSGDLTLEGTDLESVEINAVSGDAFLNCGSAEAVTFDTTSGDLRIQSDCLSGFTVYLDTVSGRFSSNCDVKNTGNTYVYGDGKMQVRVNTVSGDIEINSKQ